MAYDHNEYIAYTPDEQVTWEKMERYQQMAQDIARDMGDTNNMVSSLNMRLYPDGSVHITATVKKHMYIRNPNRK